MKKLILLLLFSISINAGTVLTPGDIVIVAINGDTDSGNNYGRGYCFMPLVYLAAGTEIMITDYGWSDLTSHFITNTSVADAFVKYTVPIGGINAGTIIRNDSYNYTNFTFIFSYTGSGNNYLNVAGLSNADEVLIFQGSVDSPTFIFAASIVPTDKVASGWATSVGANGTDGAGAGSALPPGLTDDITALSFNRPPESNDNCAFHGTTTDATKADWQLRIRTYASWDFNDAIPIPTPLTGPFVVTDAVPVELITFIANVADKNVKLNWATATEINNYGFEIERKANNSSNWNKVGFVAGNGNSNNVHNYSFTDLPTGGTNFMYRLKQVDNNGDFEYSPEVNVVLEIPQVFTVKQNFPNPFNPTTNIEYSIPEDNNVQVKIYNAIGMEVTTILNEFQQAGVHNVTFNAANFSSGIYFYKITSGNYSQIKKMILLR